MKISDLIKILEEKKKEFGDKEIYIFDAMQESGTREIERIVQTLDYLVIE